MGAKGRKDEKLSCKTAFAYIITGLLIYFFSYFSLLVKIKITHLALLYMGLLVVGKKHPNFHKLNYTVFQITLCLHKGILCNDF
jgi:hypothetical protein